MSLFQQGGHPRVVLCHPFITGKFSFYWARYSQNPIHLRDRLLPAPLPGFPCLLPLGGHRLLKSLHVEGKTVFPDDVGRQVGGKTEGVVELEDDISGDDPPRRLLPGRPTLLEDPETRGEGLDETLLLCSRCRASSN